MIKADLIAYLKRETPGVADVHRLAQGIAVGFAHVHPLQLVHRDIKLDNVMLSARGEVKICDFCFAIHLEEEADTTRRPRAGTETFLAPELRMKKLQPYGQKVGISAALKLFAHNLLKKKEDRPTMTQVLARIMCDDFLRVSSADEEKHAWVAVMTPEELGEEPAKQFDDDEAKAETGTLIESNDEIVTKSANETAVEVKAEAVAQESTTGIPLEAAAHVVVEGVPEEAVENVVSKYVSTIKAITPVEEKERHDVDNGEEDVPHDGEDCPAGEAEDVLDAEDDDDDDNVFGRSTTRLGGWSEVGSLNHSSSESV
ncbi:hypothetical protein BGX29_009668 [Mortierella sp. GBA35]|nr:hypothetical protein BGX29_009668 [Mortierella sp. GBA35]